MILNLKWIFILLSSCFREKIGLRLLSTTYCTNYQLQFFYFLFCLTFIHANVLFNFHTCKSIPAELLFTLNIHVIKYLPSHFIMILFFPDKRNPCKKCYKRLFPLTELLLEESPYPSCHGFSGGTEPAGSCFLST